MNQFTRTIEEARTRYAELLQPAKKRGTFICPLCGNGTGSTGDGITPVPHKNGSLKCFKCGFSGDIFDLYQKEHNISQQDSFTEVLSALGYNLGNENKKHSNKLTGAKNTMQKKEPQKVRIREEQYTRPKEDRLEDQEALNYIHSRGITLGTARRFGLFYMPEWVSPKAEGGETTPLPSKRICIPTSEGGYTARAIEQGNPKYSKMKHGPGGFLNLDALGVDSEEPVFITEGEFDALSLLEIGADAVSVGSVSMLSRFAEMLEEYDTRRPIVICLDNDQAGQKAQQNFLENLSKPAFFCIGGEITGDYKDANEFLVNNRGQFEKTVQATIERVKTLKAIQDAQQIRQTNIAGFMSTFQDHIQDSSRVKPISTGFNSIDKPLGGGLYPGLYFLGAISSLGKTTFMLQVAENISKGGTDVLFFSLEMSKDELIAKTISRLTYEISLYNGRGVQDAKTTLGILDGNRYQHYHKPELELIEQAMNRYTKENAPQMWIFEGVGDIGVIEIRKAIKKHIHMTGKRPVVFIDYLQILSPYDIKATDKQNTDKAVLELKRISRDFSIPVLAISSLNRESYTAPVNVSSFKESGAIEYSADVLIGMQLDGMDYQKGDAKEKRTIRINELMDAAQDKQRSGQPVTCQIKILKNRNGPKENRVLLDFTARFNDYRESQNSHAADSMGWTQVEPDSTDEVDSDSIL